ncbi:hypothetical protein P171DRAFT_458232 [Karstenula rhodostoma CBS 690.94]|uniref:Uncharacterized protein n=1 Tax=Karstenula rhodostoma CBS 690.94 TaxID=1392251 RepID=A0A9P4P9B6_9PLEO|nr:hypothetical protein P171DRAFT_458232 [Karstenula rhodostoma CBS 690.94]
MLFPWKIFALPGFGWFVANGTITIVSVALVQREFNVKRIAFLTVANGRRIAFNMTLLISSVAGFADAGSPRFVTVCPVDLVMLLFGQAIAILVGWPLIANYSCPSTTPKAYWTFGGPTLVMLLLRLFLGNYEKRSQAEWITPSCFEAIYAQPTIACSNNPVTKAPSSNIVKRSIAKVHPEKIKVLFLTPHFALNTTLLIFFWCSIGVAYPLYNSFIPFCFENKGVERAPHPSLLWNFGFTLGGFTVEMKCVGRKGTGTLACLCAGLILSLFTQAKSSASVLGFTCNNVFFQTLVYGLLYLYTPECLPAPVRRMRELMASIIRA